MKKFLKIFIYFFIPIVIASACLEVYMRHIPNSYKYKDEWMKKNGNSVETLILGSSHAYYGINPEYLPGNAFNLANVSQDLERDFFVLDKYKDYEKNLKNVILVLSYEDILGNLGGGAEAWRAEYYGIYMGEPSTRYSMEISNAMVGYKLISSIRGNDMLGCSRLGFGTGFISSKRRIISEKSIWKTLMRKERFNADGTLDTTYLLSNISYLNSIINFCKETSCRLFIVFPPVASEYFARCNKEQLNLFNRVIANELHVHPGIIFHDYSNDSRFGGIDFYDCDHLSDIGAEKFTHIINNELLSNLQHTK